MHDDMARADTTELRLDMPGDVVTVLDAISLAQRLNRNQLVLRILADWCDERVHEHSLLSKLSAGNPAMAEKLGKGRT